MPDPKKKSSALMRTALGGSAILVIAGLGAFWYASQKAQQQAPKEEGDVVTVTIEGKVCKPNEITVPAGRTTFRIVNNSDRALEWEILDGIMVVEERENIAPGFAQTMRVKLRPGDYDITCGLLSNPRGKLHVTPSADSEAEAARPSAVNFLGALAEYRFYMVSQTSQLQDATEQLVAAIKAGNLKEAQALYAPAHQFYKRIEPMAEMFADLDQRINGRADYFEKREADPAFRGFHRLEYTLFGQSAPDLKALAPIADELQADLGKLKERLSALDIKPERLASSASRLLRRTADNLPTGGRGLRPAGYARRHAQAGHPGGAAADQAGSRPEEGHRGRLCPVRQGAGSVPRRKRLQGRCPGRCRPQGRGRPGQPAGRHAGPGQRRPGTGVIPLLAI